MRARGLLLVLVGCLVLLVPAGAWGGTGHTLTFSFDGAETPAGSLGDANGVAVDEATGNVYVADIANNVVDKFTAAGVYVSQITGSGTPAGGFAFANPAALAVDNSTNPLDMSRGDVYVLDSGHNVVDKFDATGVYQGQLSETPGGPFAGVPLLGVAVDVEGNVWVYQVSAEVDEFDSSGGFITSFSTNFGASPGFAVDSLDDVFFVRGEPKTEEETSTGIDLGEVDSCGCTVAIATDQSANDVYVDDGSHVVQYDSTKSLISQFGGSQLTASGEGGVAVNSATGGVYVANPSDGKVYAYDTVLVPDATTSAASGVQDTTVTLNGTVNPDGVQVTSCSFEYGTDASYGQSMPCAQIPAEIGSGSGPVTVSADISGLQANVAYHFRLIAGNANGTNEAARDATFTTLSPPLVGEESLSPADSTSAMVSARIDPLGSPTVYHVEYGTSTAYGSSTPEVSLGSSQGAVGVQVQLSGLQLGTLYHFRFLASNVFGSTLGADATFTTAAVGGSALPDERAYEKVSPAGNGEVYAPESFASADAGDSKTGAPFRAGAGGGAVVYVGGPPGSGVGGNGNQISGSPIGNEYLARRTAEGWTASDIEPPQPLEGGSLAYYQSFSDDLSLGFFSSTDQPPLAGAPGHCNVLYARGSGDSAFSALLTATLTPGECGQPVFAGVSADGSRSFFQTEAALTPGAVAAPGYNKEEKLFCFFDCNLYESVGGALSLVNLLPGGGVDVNATFGGTSENTEAHLPDFSNAVSADGARAFWTDVSTNVVYVREDGTSTVQVSTGAARFWTASVDGRFAFYTEGEKLLRFDVESGTRVELAGAGAGVQGVAGVSDDGSYVYFVADGALASGATPQTCSGEANGEGCNLYVLHVGEPVRFIATLAPTDNEISVISGNEHYGDWQSDLGSRTAEVTPDGRGVAFSSTRPLTGYDNRLPRRNEPSRVMPEVFVYEYEGGGELFCASCDPSGAPPSKSPNLLLVSSYGRGGFVVPSEHGAYMFRWVSEDGRRVFFDTAQPLVAQDTNGWVDVYEWEHEGAGSCRQAGGCVFLLSGGASSDQSFFMDASASGDDVYFMTRAHLVSEDRDGSFDLYDARVGGGFSEVAAPACAGADCQGVPPAAAAFATPSSVTFDGVGNLGPPRPAVKSKPKSKPKRCGRGFARRHGRCVKKAKAKGPGKRAKKGRK